MKKIFLSFLFITLPFIQSGYGQLFTYAKTYKVLEYGYIDSTKTYGNRLVTKNDYQLGDVNLKSLSIGIEPHGSYLDITETAILTILTTDESLKYLIGGTVSLPKKSTISSFYISNGKQEYSAKILSAFLTNSKDTSLGNAVASLKLANRAANNSPLDQYELKIFDAIPTTEYTVKIRYLTPNTGNTTSPYTLNNLCHSNSKVPGIIELNYSSKDTSNSFLLSSKGLNYQLTNGMSLQIPFQNQFKIIPLNQRSSQFHTTDITSDPWKGKYLLLNTSIPDSVKVLLSKPLETVVLWRWNKPNSFVFKYTNEDYKHLTDYGTQAITQSQAIKNLTIELSNTGNKTALVHSIQYKAPSIFPLCKKGSAAYAKLETYLDQFTSEYFLSSGYFETDIAPVNPNDTLTDSSRYEFLKSMTIAKGLYSNGAGVMKHLIILSCGPVPISRNLISIEELDSLFTDISIDKNNAVWRDINFPLIETIALKRPVLTIGNFNMPEFKPTSILLKLKTGSIDYTFPLSPDQPSFSIIAKSDSSWNPNLVWLGYNKSGAIMSTAASTAHFYNAVNDSGLVKLWAFSNERLSVTKETTLGLKYGVISEEYSMKIFPSFKGYDSTATAFATSMDYYANDSLPIKRKMISNSQNIRCAYRLGLLNITLPLKMEAKRLRLYTLSGKLIADFDPSQFKTTNGYSVKLSTLLKTREASGIVIVRIDGEGFSLTQKIQVK